MSDNSSENSAVKSDGGGDVTAKYSRLAAEYSKVLRTLFYYYEIYTATEL